MVANSTQRAVPATVQTTSRSGPFLHQPIPESWNAAAVGLFVIFGVGGAATWLTLSALQPIPRVDVDVTYSIPSIEQPSDAAAGVATSGTLDSVTAQHERPGRRSDRHGSGSRQAPRERRPDRSARTTGATGD